MRRLLMSSALILGCWALGFPLYASAQAPVPSNEWAGMNLNHKATRQDSVDWSRLDLVRKPPKVSETERDRSGEKDGLIGPMLVYGGKGRDESIVVYDSVGRPAAVVVRRDFFKRPDDAVATLEHGCHLGRGEDIEDLVSGGRIPDLQTMMERPFTEMDSVLPPRDVGIPGGFRPESVLVLRLGIPKKDLHALLVVVVERFIHGRRGTDFLEQFADMPGVYIVERVRIRFVLRKKEPSAPISPDDPLYLKPGKKKRKKLLGIFGGGSPDAPRIGFSVGGSGLGVGTGKKKGPEIRDQWGLRAVGYLPFDQEGSAWRIADGEERNVVVAVVDSGLDMTHPDGPRYVWTNPGETPDNGVDDDGNGFVDDVHGWNFVDESPDLTDRRGHGTFVAGIIAAKRNNGLGIAGIDPGAVILPVKVADENGAATSLDIARGIRYAANHGARVINVSLGSPGLSQIEQLAVNYAAAKGAFVVAASGNEGRPIEELGPAAARRVFTIGGLDFGGARSTVSSHGPNNALMAPIEDIYSLHSKDAPWKGPAGDRERLYLTQSGTSFAAPIVAATAALMLSKDPTLAPDDLKAVLAATAVDMEEPGWDDETGFGALDAAAALRGRPEDAAVIQITEVVRNLDDRKRLESVDLYAWIRGVPRYEVQVGRGERPRRFQPAAGPFSGDRTYEWVARIPASRLRGGRSWTLRIFGTASDGREVSARTVVETR